jgi:hypothetical protein
VANIIINSETPVKYLKFLEGGDFSGNFNGAIDTADEANLALDRYCSTTSEEECRAFLTYLTGDGFCTNESTRKIEECRINPPNEERNSTDSIPIFKREKIDLEWLYLDINVFWDSEGKNKILFVTEFDATWKPMRSIQLNSNTGKLVIYDGKKSTTLQPTETIEGIPFQNKYIQELYRLYKYVDEIALDEEAARFYLTSEKYDEKKIGLTHQDTVTVRSYLKRLLSENYSKCQPTVVNEDALKLQTPFVYPWKGMRAEVQDNTIVMTADLETWRWNGISIPFGWTAGGK